MRKRLIDDLNIVCWLACSLVGQAIDEIQFRRLQRRTARTYGRS